MDYRVNTSSWLNQSTTSTRPPPSSPPSHPLSTADFIVITIYLIILVFGLLGNLLVVRYFGFKNKVRRLYHIYLIHLAVADLISATVTSCYFVSSLVSGHTWYLGEIPCRLVSLMGPLTVNVSAWLLVSIAYERYRGIYSPFRPRLSKLRIHLTVSIIWFVSVVLLIPYAMSTHLIDGWCRMQWPSPVYELTYAIGTLIVQSLVPIAYMTFTVNRILYALRNRMKEVGLQRINSKYSSCSRETSFMSTSIRGTTEPSSKCTSGVEKPAAGYSGLMPQGCPGSDTKYVCRQIKSVVVERKYRESVRLETHSRRTLSVPSLVANSTTGTVNNPKSNNNLQELSSPENSVSPPSCQSLLKQISSAQLPRKQYRLSSSSVNALPGHFFTSAVLLHESVYTNSTDKRASIDNDGVLDDERTSLYNTTFAAATELTSSEYAPKSSVYRRLRNIFHADRKEKGLNPVRQRQRIAMLVVTFSVFVVCSLPYNVFYVAAIVIYDFVQDHSQLEVLQNINLWLSTLVVLNSIMNCFIYAGMDNGFKQYCLRLFRVCRNRTRKAPKIQRQSRQK